MKSNSLKGEDIPSKNVYIIWGKRQIKVENYCLDLLVYHFLQICEISAKLESNSCFLRIERCVLSSDVYINLASYLYLSRLFKTSVSVCLPAECHQSESGCTGLSAPWRCGPSSSEMFLHTKKKERERKKTCVRWRDHQTVFIFFLSGTPQKELDTS